MNKLNDGGPAFPLSRESSISKNYEGMSLRDYFAAKAMTRAMAVSPARWWKEGANIRSGTPDMDQCARIAYAMADAMLKAREE